MATTTATPLDTKAEAKAAKKKEPKPSFNERWMDKKGWVRRFRCCRPWFSPSF